MDVATYIAGLSKEDQELLRSHPMEFISPVANGVIRLRLIRNVEQQKKYRHRIEKLLVKGKLNWIDRFLLSRNMTLYSVWRDDYVRLSVGK
jgi:hypothetical protein